MKEYSTCGIAECNTIQILKTKGIPYKRHGAHEIEADINGTGHLEYKINISKGVYFSTADDEDKGTVRKLLRKLGITDHHFAPVIPLTSPVSDQRLEKDRKEQISKAQRLWRSGWTITHDDDMPAGWDQGLSVWDKGIVRKRIEEQRDAAIRYFRSRFGADYLWAIRQVRSAGLDPHDQDYERIGAVCKVLFPMHDIASGLCGVQRLYLLADGSKAQAEGLPTRKMLGAKGIVKIHPPVGRPVAATIPPVLVGEGWETVASAVLAAGVGGVACYDAGNLVAWVQSLASNDRLKVAGGAVHIGVLVDRDLSGTGQKASAKAIRLLRAAGYAADYLCPPDSVKGGAKGADWSDALGELGTEGARIALGLSVETGKSALDLIPVDQDSIHAGLVSALWSVRKAKQPTKRHQTIIVEEARAMLQHAVDRFIGQVIRWYDAQTPDDDDKAKAKIAPPTLGLESLR